MPIPAQFCSPARLEAAVVEAFEVEHPDVIIVDGQGALSHPTYLSFDRSILRGSLPGRRDPATRTRADDRLSDFPNVPMPTLS